MGRPTASRQRRPGSTTPGPGRTPARCSETRVAGGRRGPECRRAGRAGCTTRAACYPSVRLGVYPSRLRIHADLVALLVLVLELDLTVDHGEQGVVRRPAHVQPGVELGAALLDEDGPGGDELSGEAFHAQILGAGVAAVAGGADAFLVSHFDSSVLELHVGDPDLGERLAMPGLAPEPGAAGEAVDLDLLALAVSHHFGRHLGALQDRLAGVHVLAVAGQQHAIEGQLAPGLACEQRDLDRDAGLGPVLDAADGKNGVGHEGRNVNEGNRLVKRRGTAVPCPYATAYCSVTSLPAGWAIIRNSSRRIIGSSRTSSSSPVCFSNCRRKFGSCSTRYSATSGCSRTASWRSLCSAPARLSERSMRRTTTSGRNTRPVPWQVGHSAVMECHSDGRTRWRVISTRPSSDTANALVRARSRPR